ncbi:MULTISPECIES: Gfo/Idh/MocA family protein [Actinoalloteichus]|uniref:Dehydrogenase n=1 Tax=Actinoalloteichus fjordicus TaxID=1612552 RepID=A0AAC9PTS0_9PSEU|nr:MULTISPECIES: Gfo/Idh/MocA family oxidoreductase [Actinoalloteichus]APU16448.1 putative dehydrogenase [Actinoalloteichus fjordicus]APU22507.1 putative dehydrogenase [Actinoalloteichus sp. GBA129-24]
MTQAGADRLRVGVVGCGTISRAYLENLIRIPSVRVVACGDLLPERAAEAAALAGVDVWGGPETVVGSPDVDLVLNLTIPAVHAEVAEAALAAGQHVYGEKPIANSRAELAGLVAAAERADRRLGSAPDTFLGAGVQSAIRFIQAGGIGRPLSAVVSCQGPGPESWHPAPEFLFAAGGGPLLDMGPYYVTALVAMLGPVERVSAVARQAWSERVIGSGPRAGTRFPVVAPTHTSAQIELACGAVVTAVFSFDTALRRQGVLEVNGTEGTLRLPDPNRFDGVLRLRRPGAQEWEDLPTVGATLGRGLGVAEMAEAIRAGRPHRADARLAGHVLDTLLSIGESAEQARFVPVTSRCASPAPLGDDWSPLAGADPTP